MIDERSDAAKELDSLLQPIVQRLILFKSELELEMAQANGNDSRWRVLKEVLERIERKVLPSDPDAVLQVLQPQDGAVLVASEEKAEKRLTTKERNNLLRIIAALAKEAKIDLAIGTSVAVQVECLVVGAGFDGPKEQAIRGVLKQVRELQYPPLPQ